MIRELVKSIVKEASKVLIEREEDIKLLTLSTILGGHALIEGVPGIGKTLTVKVMARLLGLKFSRVQMTPDLLPADIMGTKIYDESLKTFRTILGPIHSNIVLADEINRASPRTQSALLEAMQEGQVTIEGETYRLPQPFIVIATMNPIELEGVFPLPEAQLDRFFIKISMKQLSDEGLRRLLNLGLYEIEHRLLSLKPITSADELLRAREELSLVKVKPLLINYLISLGKGIETHRATKVGISPRGIAMLLRLAKALAVLDGRNYVIPDDVKAAALPALSHRIFIKPEFLGEVTGEEVVRAVLDSVEVPKYAERARSHRSQ